MRRAVLFGQRAFFIGAGRADQLQAQRFGPLAGNQPDTPGCGMEQDEIA